MFEALEKIRHRPKPFEFYTAGDLWNDEYISARMLELHLDEKVDLASRNRDFIQRSLDWMIDRFKIGEGTRVCDFGCGPGLYTASLARKGAYVTGIDFSERSIKYAREVAEREGLGIDYVLQNYLEYSTNKQFDLITMIFLDICPLSPEQRKIMLEKFHSILADDGFLFLDVLSMNHFEQAQEGVTFEYCPANSFWSADPCYQFLSTFKYEEENLVLYKHTVVEKERTRVIYNWLQCYSLESLKREFEASGFQIIEQYSDVSGTARKAEACAGNEEGSPYISKSNEIAVVAKKLG